MTLLDSIVLGIVEGLTEFLPISSTAHLVVASDLLQIPSSAFLSSFIIAIQLGAIASVVLVYWRTLLFDFETLKRVAIAFIPTALVGFVLYKLLKDVLIENLSLIAWMLILGGIILVLFERYHTEGATSDISYKHACLIGFIQALAIVPGVSRAGATVIGGLSLGITREKIVEFSFLLAVPTMIAATGYDLLKSGAAFAESDWLMLATGFATAFVAAFIAVKWLIRYVQTHSFALFGWYRIVLGIALLIWLA